MGKIFAAISSVVLVYDILLAVELAAYMTRRYESSL
jgi:hypothetical protein